MSKSIKGRKKSSKKKKWSIKKKVIISTLIVFALVMATLATGYFFIRSKVYSGIDTQEITSDEDYKEVEGITNVLLIGTDARDLDEASRADSMIIATLDNNNKNIKLTSLFRDTLVDIPGHGEGKLNAALAYGGPELLLKTIKNTYGISINKYVIINFWGFEAVIDQMGGIELNVEDYMLNELNKYIGESTGGNDCPVTHAGVQILNGKQALSYARIRKGVGDEYARTDRQREVIIKVAEKLKQTKPSKYLSILNEMLEHIKTNIDPLQAVNMAYTIYKFPSLDIKQIQIPIPELAEGRLYKNLGWVFLMDKDQNAKILNEFIFDNKMPNPDEYDYTSFKQAMADYRSEEKQYNNKHNINPEDYIDNSSDIENTPNSSYDENSHNTNNNTNNNINNNTNNNTNNNINNSTNNNTDNNINNNTNGGSGGSINGGVTTQPNEPQEPQEPETPEMPETTPGGSGDDNTNTKPDGGVELQPDGSIGGGEETTPTVNPTE